MQVGAGEGQRGGMTVIVFLDEVDSILTAWFMASRIVVRS